MFWETANDVSNSWYYGKNKKSAINIKYKTGSHFLVAAFEDVRTWPVT